MSTLYERMSRRASPGASWDEGEKEGLVEGEKGASQGEEADDEEDIPQFETIDLSEEEGDAEGQLVLSEEESRPRHPYGLYVFLGFFCLVVLSMFHINVDTDPSTNESLLETQQEGKSSHYLRVPSTEGFSDPANPELGEGGREGEGDGEGGREGGEEEADLEAEEERQEAEEYVQKHVSHVLDEAERGRARVTRWVVVVYHRTGFGLAESIFNG